jgi:hypothetical protein
MTDQEYIRKMEEIITDAVLSIPLQTSFRVTIIGTRPNGSAYLVVTLQDPTLVPVTGEAKS